MNYDPVKKFTYTYIHMYIKYVNMLSDIDKVETENSEMVDGDKYVPDL